MLFIRLITLVFFINLISCQSQKLGNKSKHISIEFEALALDKNVRGSILIYDLNNKTYYSNDYDWAKSGRIPASTFKIPHSLIALELGITKNEASVFRWDGEKRAYKLWQQDLTFKQAFHYSCVPCYQEIARKVGTRDMNTFMKEFNYGTMDIHNNNIDEFWLVGESKINQYEQIDFLKRLYLSHLPISMRTDQLFKQLFIVKQTTDYILRAKTGLAVKNGNYNTWYVGYIEKAQNVYFFATNISPKGSEHKSLVKKRKGITIKAMEQLHFLSRS